MTTDRSACRRIIVAAMLHASLARAGVWTTDPTLGLSGEYSTNPALLPAAHTAETHGAVLIDIPTTYTANATKFFITPSFRVSDSSGYSSIASDYEHLNVGGEIDGERNTLSFSGQVARDSSLYYTYSVDGSTGVRRDTTSADVNWARSLTERTKFSFEVSPSRVLYGNTGVFTSLTDYRYTSAAPAFSWDASERTTLTVTGGLGLYNSINGQTKSSNSQLEVGFSRHIDELWTATANAGYSRVANRIEAEVLEYQVEGFFLVPVLVLKTAKSTTNGTVFSTNLTRKGELLAVTLAASRTEVPTGFSFLARQDSYQLNVDYPATERWTFDSYVRRIKSVEAQLLGTTTSQSYWAFSMSADWLITEHWTVKMGASRVTARYTPPPVAVAASGVTLQLSRKFNTLVWD